MESSSPSRAADALAVAALLATGAVVGWPIVTGGHLSYLDNPAHLAELYAAAFEAQSGWSEVAFCGFPITTLHSPLWYGFLSWLARIGVGSWPYVLCVWLGLVAPPLALYRVARRVLSPMPAAAMAYALLVQRPAIVGVGSASGGMWTFYVASAALILLIDRLSLPYRTRRDAAVVAALTGLTLLSHLYAVVPLALIAVIHLWVVTAGRRGDRRALAWQAAAGILGVLAAAAYWAPMILARKAMVIYSQNLDATSVLARLIVPTHVFELLNRRLPPIDAAAVVGSLPMVAIVVAGLLGVVHLTRRKNDAPLYGALIAAVLLTVLLFFTGEFDIKLLGPGSWRMLYFVRLGLVLAAVPMVARVALAIGRRFGTMSRWSALAIATGAVALGWWFGAPLRSVVPPPRGQEMVEVEKLWDWLRANRDDDWGRVYLQDTFALQRSDVKLSQSHVLALTAHQTGVYQLGATYGVAPYRTVAWTPSEFGGLFRRAVYDERVVDEVKALLWAANATHVVTSDLRTQEQLDSSPDFEHLHQEGRFAVFRATTVANEWASPKDSDAQVTVDAFSTGRYRLRVRTSRPGQTVLVKSSYHPAWRLYCSAGVEPRIRQEDSGLMLMDGLGVGETAVEMDYRPRRWPATLSLCAWVGIVGLFVVKRRRGA